jgi:hypothetical protein
MIEAIANNSQESRKEWLLWMLERAGKKSGNVTQFQFWQQHNQPIELWSDKAIKQKIDYIHNNPVISGLVSDSFHYKYSSARKYQDDNSILEIDDSGFMG